MPGAQKFKQAKVERQAGELARLKVVRGPDYGWVFVITAPKVVLGRGENNDIVISDLKASRVHAAIQMKAGGVWSVSDNGSANGIQHNGKVTREALLRTGDTVTIGETTLEFIAGEAATVMLSAPAKSFAQVQLDHAALAARSQSVAGGFGGEGGKKPLLLIAAVAALAFVFLSESPEQSKPSRSEPAPAVTPLVRDIASLQGEMPKNKAAEMFFDIGFREYRQGNYLRARKQFETVLQVVPDHYLAARYLDTCDRRIEEEVKFHLEQGKRTLNSGKPKQARGHFETVMRLLHRNQSDPAFVEAKEQREVARKLIQGGSG